jgi:NADPH:quinone reductase-like Zn-dependent oxidoreductase
MLAAVHDRYGSPDVVELREVERPVPADDEVLVRVVAASVNRADLDVIHARPWIARLAFGVRRPRNHRLGADVAGVVESVGPHATRFRPGDPVFGDLFTHGLGSFAEYACVRERALLAIPAGMPLEVAATLPHSGILAIQGLRLQGGRTIAAGDRVLIDGASGNVGPFAVQIAKARGAEVTGVASPAKLDLVRSLGADQVLDYTAVDYTATGERYDWILDTDCHHPILRVRRALTSRGVYVTLGGSGAAVIASLLLGVLITLGGRKSMGLLLGWKPFKPEDVAELADLYAAGRLRPVIDRRYPLADVVDALRYVDERRSLGKVLITVSEEA